MLLQKRDVFAVYPFFAALARDRPIPSSWELLVSILPWMSATRSGVWTYYEATSPEQQNAIYNSLIRDKTFNFLAEKYRFGMENWRTEGGLIGLDRWLDENEKHIHQLLIDMVTTDEEALNSFPSDSTD